MLSQIKELERNILRARPDIGHDLPIFARGRLTLTKEEPVTTADVSGAATLYFTPYLGCYDFDEVSLALGGFAANTNQDIFLENLVTLSATQWTNITTRATALVREQGYLGKTGDLGKRFIGTININPTGGQVEDTLIYRGVWNNYNQVFRAFHVDETTGHVYNGAIRRWNNTDVARIDFVLGLMPMFGGT